MQCRSEVPRTFSRLVFLITLFVSLAFFTPLSQAASKKVNQTISGFFANNAGEASSRMAKGCFDEIMSFGLASATNMAFRASASDSFSASLPASLQLAATGNFRGMTYVMNTESAGNGTAFFSQGMDDLSVTRNIPSTSQNYGMLLAGLGLMGVMVRRRIGNF